MKEEKCGFSIGDRVGDFKNRFKTGVIIDILGRDCVVRHDNDNGINPFTITKDTNLSCLKAIEEIENIMKGNFKL